MSYTTIRPPNVDKTSIGRPSPKSSVTNKDVTLEPSVVSSQSGSNR